MTVMTDARERAIRDLKRHCGDGRITLDELEERIDEVNLATTDAEITHALRELPVVDHDEPVVTAAQAPPRRVEESERVIPDVVLAPRRGHGCSPRRQTSNHGMERTLKTV